VVITNYVTSQSLKETVTQSEIIVLGNVIGTGEVINTSRDTQDHTKPSRDSFDIGQVYDFQVQRYVKGSGPLVLKVAQAEGVILSPQSGVTQADIDRAKAADDHVPFNTGTTYLLFLRRFPSSYPDYPDKDYYAGPSEPWRIALSADGKGVIEAPKEALLEIPSDFIPDHNMPLLPQIEQVVQAEQVTKPAAMKVLLKRVSGWRRKVILDFLYTIGDLLRFCVQEPSGATAAQPPLLYHHCPRHHRHWCSQSLRSR